jgi:hypothetical protein
MSCVVSFQKSNHAEILTSEFEAFIDGAQDVNKNDVVLFIDTDSSWLSSKTYVVSKHLLAKIGVPHQKISKLTLTVAFTLSADMEPVQWQGMELSCPRMTSIRPVSWDPPKS